LQDTIPIFIPPFCFAERGRLERYNGIIQVIANSGYSKMENDQQDISVDALIYIAKNLD